VAKLLLLLILGALASGGLAHKEPPLLIDSQSSPTSLDASN
jgi:hypothetical protein